MLGQGVEREASLPDVSQECGWFDGFQIGEAEDRAGGGAQKHGAQRGAVLCHRHRDIDMPVARAVVVELIDVGSAVEVRIEGDADQLSIRVV